jgi:hypothetical protein
MRESSEPEREEWVARLRAQARLDAEELVPRPGFAVYGLLSPDLGAGALAEAGRVNDVWERIGLAYGDWLAIFGPAVSVTTIVSPGEDRDQETRHDLQLWLDQARNSLASHAGTDAEEPATPAVFTGTDLVVDGQARPAALGRHGDLWAARAAVADDLAVVVVGRDVDPNSVRLATVADLSPYLRERGERIGRLAAARRHRPVPELPPATGVAAYRTLAEHVLDSQERDRTALDAGRAPRFRADEGTTYHALWQRAVREQARISGGDQRQADETVTLVVNHLGHLGLRAAWFRADRALRDAAIDETLRYCVLGEDVPSAPAQQAWATYWTARPRRLLAAGWLEAWSDWTRRH